MDATVRIGTLRGLLLQALDLEYPEALSDMAAQAMLHGAGCVVGKREVQRHLEYLAGPGKDYLLLVKKSSTMWLAKLTPRGKDLLAGIIEADPGVLLPPPGA